MKILLVALLMSLAYVAGAHNQKTKWQESRVEIDNQRVIVRRNIHPPHGVTPMHSHHAGVVVYLTDLRELSTKPDGSSRIVSHKAGDVAWAEAREHKLQNLSDKPSEVIEIELK